MDCALNGGAVLVTLNERDFRLSVRILGVTLLSPVDFVTLLTSPDAERKIKMKQGENYESCGAKPP